VVASLRLAYAVDVPILDYAFTGAEPPGAYIFFAALTVPGGNPSVPAELLSSSVAYFVFAP
jgi:hypothetical protein